MRDCKNCPHYVLSEDGYYGCEEWECSEEKPESEEKESDQMLIKDNETGKVREYGTNPHDSLTISEDGRCLYYYHLQCGEGSRFGGFSFVTDEEGHIPSEDDVLAKHGAEAYFNIGGFEKTDKETLAKEVDIINHLIAMAIMHGSDLGGSYDSNEYELHRAMEDWAKFRGADNYVIKEKNVTWDNEEWRILQFVER